MTARTKQIRRTLCIFIIVAGGWAVFQTAHQTPETRAANDAAQPTTQPGKVLRGLESLTHIRVNIGQVPSFMPGPQVDANTAKQIHTRVIKRLQKELPQVNPEGADKDWTLEFALMYMRDSPMIVMKVPTLTCGCRLSRAVVVDGRAATAIAYKSVAVFNKPGGLVGRDDPSDLILNAVEVFVKDWHKANPAAK